MVQKHFCLVFLTGLSIVVSMHFTKIKYIIFLKSCLRYDKYNFFAKFHDFSTFQENLYQPNREKLKLFILGMFQMLNYKHLKHEKCLTKMQKDINSAIGIPSNVELTQQKVATINKKCWVKMTPSHSHPRVNLYRNIPDVIPPHIIDLNNF